eukprot:9499074-Pyramimonas_sp.AAC.1
MHVSGFRPAWRALDEKLAAGRPGERPRRFVGLDREGGSRLGGRGLLVGVSESRGQGVGHRGIGVTLRGRAGVVAAIAKGHLLRMKIMVVLGQGPGSRRSRA